MRDFHASRLIISLLLLMTAPCSATQRQAEAAAEPKRPNIVFILADDLGVNDLSCYGRKDQPTPNLDKLAKQGCVHVRLQRGVGLFADAGRAS